MATLGDRRGQLNAVHFLEEGHRLILGGMHLSGEKSLGFVAIWDVATRLELVRLAVKDGVADVNFSEDGNVLIATGLLARYQPPEPLHYALYFWRPLRGKRSNEPKPPAPASCPPSRGERQRLDAGFPHAGPDSRRPWAAGFQERDRGSRVRRSRSNSCFSGIQYSRSAARSKRSSPQAGLEAWPRRPARRP